MTRQHSGGRPSAVTPEKRERAALLKAQGFTLKQIATRLEVSTRTVERVLKDHAKTSTAEPTAAETQRPRQNLSSAPPPADPSAGLLERVRALYGTVQAAREGLPADSDLAGKLAVDSVNLSLLLGRLEQRSRDAGGEGVYTRAEIAAGVRSLIAKMNGAIAVLGPLSCVRCTSPLHVEPVAVPESPALEAPADEPDAGERELAEDLDGYFGALSALTRSATDARALQRYARQAARLAALLARLEQREQATVTFDVKAVQPVSEKMAGWIDRCQAAGGLLCSECSRELSEELGRMAVSGESPAPCRARHARRCCGLIRLCHVGDARHAARMRATFRAGSHAIGSPQRLAPRSIRATGAPPDHVESIRSDPDRVGTPERSDTRFDTAIDHRATAAQPN
jgi:hypothetical protein